MVPASAKQPFSYHGVMPASTQRLAHLQWRNTGRPEYRHASGDQCTDHSHAAGDTDQVARTDQYHRGASREREGDTSSRKPQADIIRQHTQAVAGNRAGHSDDAAELDILGAGLALLIWVLLVGRAAIDIEEFRHLYAFRIEQVSLHHHYPAQRNGIEHAENTDDRVPAAGEGVWIMFLSTLSASTTRLNTASISAAGIAEAKVRPTLRPDKRLDAMHSSVMKALRVTPRSINSGSRASSG